MKHLTLPEAKKMLEKNQKERELSYEQRLALEHALKISRLTASKAENLVKELRKIEKITEPIACKIADILPQDPDAVRAIFAKERFNLSPEEISFIIETVGKYME